MVTILIVLASLAVGVVLGLALAAYAVRPIVDLIEGEPSE